MADFVSTMAKQPDLPEDKQVKVGKAKAGDMTQQHTDFLKEVTRLIESGEIDVNNPETFLKKNECDKLSEGAKAKIDLMMVNMAILLYHIHGFFRSKKTPDSSPQLEQMIDQLWDMKQRAKPHENVFKF